MLTNPTLDKLQRLRLTGMYDAYREQLESSRYDALDFDERFALLLDRQEAEKTTDGCKPASTRPNCARTPASKTSTTASPAD